MPSPPPPTTGLNRELYLLFAAQTVSGCGDAFRRMALSLWVFQVSSASGPAIALITLAELVPYFLMSVVGGALVDRWPKRTVLLSADLLRALLSVLLAWAALQGLWIAAVLCLVLSTILSVFSDLAAATLVPQLVEDAALERANALLNVGQQVTFIAGPVLAAVCFARFGAGPTFLVDAASFLLSAGFLAFALPKERGTVERGTSPEDGTLQALCHDVVRGWAFIRQAPTIGNLLAVTLLHSFSAGLNNTVMLFFVTATLGLPATSIAWLSASNGVAQLLTGGALLVAGQRMRSSMILRLSLFTMAIGGALVAAAPSLIVLVLGVVVTSLGNSPFNIARDTAFQRFVPTALLGRVRGAADVSAMLLFLTATSGAGWGLVWLQPRFLLVLSAVLMLLAFFTFWWRQSTYQQSEREAGRRTLGVADLAPGSADMV